MRSAARARRVIRELRDGVRRRRNDVRRSLTARTLRQRNQSRHRRVTGDVPVVVSLTTHGQRVAQVHLAVESIARGALRPQRVVLWVNERSVLDDPPAALARLVERGLEIRLAQNYGPHTKYYPYVRSQERHLLPLVTADDDVMYPRTWLRDLWRAHQAHPDAVVCHRANVVALRGDAVAPYRLWARCRSTRGSLAHFATGVSGVVYPAAFLEELAARGESFRGTAPRADDVWLHWVALQRGTVVRQVRPIPRHFLTAPGSQGTSLMSENVHLDGNDAQIRSLYSSADVARLREAGADVLSRAVT